MIRIFREIRAKILAENKSASPVSGGQSLWKRFTGKYLLYAIGEIVLVVIGILIALSINNWNENQKLKAQGKEILLEVRDNLIADTSMISNRVKEQREAAIKIDYLIHHLEEKLNYHDSLAFYFFLPVLMENFQITKSGYETLKSLGLEKVKSREIKISITNYYDVRCQNISNLVDHKNLDNTQSMSNFNKNNFKRVITTDAITSENKSGYKPINYTSLTFSDYYINYLYERKGYKLRSYNGMLTSANNAATRLLALIDNELQD